MSGVRLPHRGGHGVLPLRRGGPLRWTGTNIQHADMRTSEGGMHGEFVVEVQDLAHLEKVRRAMARVKGVLAVERREHFDDEDLGWV